MRIEDIDSVMMVNARRFLQGLAISAVFVTFLAPYPGRLVTGHAWAAPQAGETALSKLYERLGKARDQNEAREIEAAISRQWLSSGSATADLLLTRAHVALGMDDPALAIELLDRVIALSPDWAEAYARRGQIFMALGDHDRAVADFNQVLIRDERHYETLANLAELFVQDGVKRSALQFYERALAINPHLEGGAKKLEKLRLAVNGQPL